MIHADWIKILKEQDPTLVLPPPSLQELNLDYIEVKENEFIIAKLPFHHKFTNPKGIFQGGFLSAAVDEVFGPLSYISMKSPCISLNLNLTFIRPFIAADEYCFIRGDVITRTNQFIFLRAEIKNQDGKIIAHGESHMTKVQR